MKPTWDASPHVAPLPVPALVTLILHGVPGRSLWRHRLTALLAFVAAWPSPTHTSIPSNPSPPACLPKGPGAWREVGHWRWDWKSQSQPSVLSASLSSTELYHSSTFFYRGSFKMEVCLCFHSPMVPQHPNPKNHNKYQIHGVQKQTSSFHMAKNRVTKLQI